MHQCEASLAAAKHAADVTADLYERGAREHQVSAAMAKAEQLAADAMTHVLLAQRLTAIKAALPAGGGSETGAGHAGTPTSGQAASTATILRLAAPHNSCGCEPLGHCATLPCQDGEEEVCSAFKPFGLPVPR
jgi:hypothetical protein